MVERVRTLKDLAAKLDVSVATVSRALAGHERIAKETRDRVSEAARRYGYVPNRTARALVSGRSGFVGLVMPSRGAGHVDPFLSAFLAGLSDGLARHGSDLFLTAVPEGASEMTVLRHLVEGRRADGFVLARTTEDDARVAYLAQTGVPFVTFGRVARPVAGHHWVDTDGAAAFAEAFSLLHGLGHRHIGVVTISEPMMFRRLREDGLALAVAEHGDPSVRITTVATPRFDDERRVAAVRALLSGADRPTAILALFDGLALTVLEEAAALGMAVPEALSVIGFDNVPAAAHARPPLTTFDAAIHDCAREIADILAARIESGDDAACTRLVRPRLVLRQSHGPAPPDP